MRHAPWSCLTVVAAATLSLACGPASDADDDSRYATGGGIDPGSEGPDAGTSEGGSPVLDDSSGSETGAETGAEGDDGGVKFDMPADEPPGADEQPCGVDILFVIDNSGSMSQHKDDIVAAFDAFIDEMIAALAPGTPVHVGITRATGFFDPGNGSGWDQPSCEFGYLDGTWNPPTQGNNGINGQQGRLFEQDGQRYFEYEIGDDPNAIGQWFFAALSEAIELDDSSNSESVVAAAAYPFAPINAAYNQGFIRDKAVLVLFLLSDAPDASPAAISTADFVALVEAAKPDCGADCVLPTGIVQSACYGAPGNVNTRLYEFMHGFGGPPAALDFFVGKQGPESFTSVLGATLAETIAFTCEHVVPVE